MPERPLVLFAKPAVADKEKRHGGGHKFHKPPYDRQLARISPMFEVLQSTFEQGNARVTTSANAIDPEYTLVFETVGDPAGFYTAIKTLQAQYPSVEWIMELSDNCPNDDDFYAIDKNGIRIEDKELSTKIFCVLTNHRALSQILSLWNRFKTNENAKFERGLAGFQHLFRTLKDVHQWGVRERIEDTGLLECWESELESPEVTMVRTQIELFFRTSEEKRNYADKKISNLIGSFDGRIISKSIIPEIHYHAILADIPRTYVQQILDGNEVELILAEEIMFMKGVGQTIAVGTSETTEDAVDSVLPERIFNEPIVAVFDGMPQENHPLLKDLLIVDDPDSLASSYPVNERIHGTSMASLILRGQNMGEINNEIHRIYIRPIMKSQRSFSDRIEEYIPDDFLLVDKIHECIRRLFEPSAGEAANTVRIINLSIGILYREYYNMISPLARLLDWLSYKYRVLFVVSAGNHLTESLQLGVDFSEFAQFSDDQKNRYVYKYLNDNYRNLQYLSPAESMNALTIGSIFSDNNNGALWPNMTNLCSDGIPAIYGSYGRGINGAVKPDILYPGGRALIRKDPIDDRIAHWVNSIIRKPGIQSAYPGSTQTNLGSVGYSLGTSNSTALISFEAANCYDVLNKVFIAETGETIPYEYAAVLIKAMLVHGTSWGKLKEDCITHLGVSGVQTKSELHKLLGYGVADVEKVKECTKNQITLIGYGDIKQNEAYEYSIPLPFNFYARKYKRKLTITLAYFSPIHPASIKYREKQVWFTINNGKDVAGTRAEYYDKAVQRGTLQHEIFETENITVWDEENALTIKVNCRGDAFDKNDKDLIPYALFATFEMAPEYDIDVYQKVVEKIRMKNIITPTFE